MKMADIKLKGYLLLVLYFIGISPSFIHYHHDEDIIPFSQATQCEKVIYYGAEEGSCNHKSHITKIHTPCWLCDYISNINQILFNTDINIELIPEFADRYFLNYINPNSSDLINISNKSPPLNFLT